MVFHSIYKHRVVVLGTIPEQLHEGPDCPVQAWQQIVYVVAPPPQSCAAPPCPPSLYN